MRVCPVDLECCGRPECGDGHCALSGERAMTPCAECGVLVVLVRPVAVCVDCAAETEEA